MSAPFLVDDYEINRDRISRAPLMSVKRWSTQNTTGLWSRFVSSLDRYFMIRALGSNFKREIFGGISSFLVCLYILSENPDYLARAGMHYESVFVATCLMSGLGTLAMGLIARVPIIIAPGMGLNSFFAIALVQTLKVPWQTALGYTCIHGIILTGVILVGSRVKLLSALPDSFRVGVCVGIAIFLGFAGLNRMGLNREPQDTLHLSYELVLGIATLILAISLLSRLHLVSAYLISVLVSTVISIVIRWIWYPDELHLRWHNIESYQIFGKLNFDFDIRGLYILPTMVLQHLFDSASTVMGLLQVAYLGHGLKAGVLTKEDYSKVLGGSNKTRDALLVDAIVSTIGSVFGTSTTTSFIESAVGIGVGARTGFSSVIASLLFFSGLFLGPIYNLIPRAATGPMMMMTCVISIPMIADLNLESMVDLVSALFAALYIPYSLMIGNGAALSYVITFFINVIATPWKEGSMLKRNPNGWLLSTLAIIQISLNVFLYKKDDNNKSC